MSSPKRTRLATQWYSAALTYINHQFVPNMSVLVNETTGRIDRVLPTEELPTSEPVVRLPHNALVPGLVNCHSHSFQIGLRGKGEVFENPTDSFWTWRQEMYKLVKECNPDKFYDLVHRCFTEMRRSGITTVGEFHYFHHDPSTQHPEFQFDRLLLKAAKDVGIRIVLLNAFYKYGGFGSKPLNEAQKHFSTSSTQAYWNNMDHLLDSVLDPHTQSLGVVAHSLRAVGLDDLQSLHKEACRRKLPFHLHIEEQPAEVEQCKEAHSDTPMRVLLTALKDSNVHDLSRTTAVHCNHTTAPDMDEFVEKGGIVCICPLTEGNLGDGIMAQVSRCKGRLCVGSDCNARIDMFEELRWLEYTHRLRHLQRGVCVRSNPKMVKPDAAADLLYYGTSMGARSLCVDAGEITEGKLADFVLIDLDAAVVAGSFDSNTGASLAASLVFGSGASQVVANTCVGGAWMQPIPPTSS